MREKRMGHNLGKRLTVAMLILGMLLGMMPATTLVADDENILAPAQTEQDGTAAVEQRTTEPPTIYLDGVRGDDINNGTTEELAVKTFVRVRYLLSEAASGSAPGENPAGGPGTVVVTGTVTETDSCTWGNLNATAGALTVKRGDGFKDAMLVVDTKDVSKWVKLKNGIVIDGAGEGVTTPAIVLQSGKLYTTDSSTVIKNNCNTALNGHGGGILVEGGLLEIWFEPGVAIQGNSAAFGGGIYAKSGAEVKLTGNDNSSITGNTASVKGGGIYMESGATLTLVSDKINISGNLVSSEENNVYLAESAVVTAGDLSEHSIIGINTEALPTESDVITVARQLNSPHWLYTPSTFVSDNESYRVALSADGKSIVLKLAQNIVYLGGTERNDQNFGRTADTAVATIDQAIALVEDGGTVVVCGETAIPTKQTKIDKALTFTGAYQEADYFGTALLKLYHPQFKKDVVFQNMKISNVFNAGGLCRYYPIEGAQLTLENVTFLERETVLQAQSSPDGKTYGLTIKNCPSLFLYGIMYFDSVSIDRSVVETFYFTGTSAMYVLNVTLQNASHLMTRQAIGTLTSVGAGNILTTQPNPDTRAARQLNGTVTVTQDNPILLRVRDTSLSDGLDILTSATENSTLTPDKFYLEDGSFYLTKIGNTLTARKNKLTTGIPDEITKDSVQLHGIVSDIEVISALGFRWWKVGDETKTTVDVTPATAFSATLTGLTSDMDYAYEATATIAGNTYSGGTIYFRTAKENLSTGSIDGGVTNNTGKDCAVTVTIEEGNTICATQTLGIVSNNARSEFNFTNLPDGFYNVVADNGEYKVTRLVEVKGGEAPVEVELMLGKTQSVVEIVTPDTPSAAVDGLPEQFEDENMVEEDKKDTGYTPNDKIVVTDGGTVELKLTVERKDEVDIYDDATLITGEATGQTIPIYLDLSVFKTVIPTSGNATETKLVSVPKLLTVVLLLPSEAIGKRNITIYRVHDRMAETLLKADPGENGEWAEISGANAILHIRQFSTYAVGYTKSTPPAISDDYNENSTYPPNINDSEHGNTTVLPKNPRFDDKVTITPKPEEGYTVDEVIVTDKNGKEVTVKDNGDGSYTFTQPIGNVTITVNFKPIRPVWNPFVDVKENDWFHDSVKYIYENDLMIGTSSTTFSPYLDTSRGMIITILWRMENSTKASKAAAFPDIASDQYYSDAVAWGAENDIVRGYDTGLFGPADPITREQLATMLWRYAKFKKQDISIGESINILSYPDFAQISEYAIPAIQWVCGADIMRGKGNGILDPTGRATRAETSAMLTRYQKNK